MLRNTKHVIFSCGLLAVAAASGGCQHGPAWKLASVEGTVTKDGRPLQNMEVIFLAETNTGTEGPRTQGITDAAGHYRLRTDIGDEGAVVGKYRVVILDLQAALIRMKRSGRGTQGNEGGKLPPGVVKRLEELEKSAANASQVPPSYGSFSETPLRVEVRLGAQVIDLEVK